MSHSVLDCPRGEIRRRTLLGRIWVSDVRSFIFPPRLPQTSGDIAFQEAVTRSADHPSPWIHSSSTHLAPFRIVNRHLATMFSSPLWQDCSVASLASGLSHETQQVLLTAFQCIPCLHLKKPTDVVVGRHHLRPPTISPDKTCLVQETRRR
jgi:hypothetical protein